MRAGYFVCISVSCVWLEEEDFLLRVFSHFIFLKFITIFFKFKSKPKLIDGSYICVKSQYKDNLWSSYVCFLYTAGMIELILYLIYSGMSLAWFSFVSLLLPPGSNRFLKLISILSPFSKCNFLFLSQEILFLFWISECISKFLFLEVGIFSNAYIESPNKHFCTH